MGGVVVSVGQARGFDEFYQACYGRLLRQVARGPMVQVGQ